MFMNRFFKQPVRAEVIALWRTRFAAVRQKLSETPTADHVWYWQVQERILGFLLRRYTVDKNKSSHVALETPSPPQVPVAPSPAVLEVTPSGSFIGAAGDGKMPRLCGAIRPALHDIVAGNQNRYQRLKSQHEQAIRSSRQERLQFRVFFSKVVYELCADAGGPAPQPRMLNNKEINQMLSQFFYTDGEGERSGDPSEQSTNQTIQDSPPQTDDGQA
jgi:hypothetical protein